MAVPKVIHYCWFGGGPLSRQAERTLQTWRKYSPEYEIKRWDEGNFNVEDCSFVSGAYAAKKWAFVSDYARFKVLYEFGGVYMDVGSELIKGIDEVIVEHAPLVGIENGSWTATPGLIAACDAHNKLIGDVLKKYRALAFEDSDDFCASHTVNDMLTDILVERGYVRDGSFQRVCEWTFLPPEYFDPSYGFGGYSVTANTYSIHKGSGSWGSPALKKKHKVEHRLTPLIGRRAAQIAGRIIGEISCNGLVDGASNLFSAASDVLARKKDEPPKLKSQCSDKSNNLGKGDEGSEA